MIPAASSTGAEQSDQSILHRLRDMNRLKQPAWVFDIDHGRILWANSGSLALWQADSLDELLGRELGNDMSPAVAKRLLQYQNDFIRDENAEFCEIWTLYPNGEPQTIEIVFSGICLDDGRMAMFCEALQEQQLTADGLRSAEAYCIPR